VIHGGYGSFEGMNDTRKAVHESLTKIVNKAYAVLLQKNAKTAVVEAVKLMEDDPLYNAGTGSRIQADGKIRMSASFMHGNALRFSGIINIQNIQNPIEVAQNLQNEHYPIIACNHSNYGQDIWNLPHYNPETEHRRKEYESRRKGKTGTVGAVAIDINGNIVAGTSTGGIGNETPGRVGDSPTVAGNYASKNAGVSVTGIGEEIVNLSVASRIVSLVDEEINLNDAVQSVMARAKENKYNFGIISLDRFGNCIVEKTTEEIYYASSDGQAQTFYH